MRTGVVDPAVDKAVRHTSVSWRGVCPTRRKNLHLTLSATRPAFNVQSLVRKLGTRVIPAPHLLRREYLAVRRTSIGIIRSQSK